MEIFDLLTQDEVDALPEDDQYAFLEVVKIADVRHERVLKELDGQKNEWEFVQEAQHAFQNVIMAAATRFNIEPILKKGMPDLDGYETINYRQFRADLTNILTQIMLHRSKENRSESVPLLSDTKDQLRSYVFHLRTAIDNNEGFEEWRRKRLHAALSKFEDELIRGRFRFKVATATIFALITLANELPGAAANIDQMAIKIMHVLAEAKARDDEQRRISRSPPTPLLLQRIPAKPEIDFDREIPF